MPGRTLCVRHRESFSAALASHILLPFFTIEDSSLSRITKLEPGTPVVVTTRSARRVCTYRTVSRKVLCVRYVSKYYNVSLTKYGFRLPLYRRQPWSLSNSIYLQIKQRRYIFLPHIKVKIFPLCLPMCFHLKFIQLNCKASIRFEYILFTRTQELLYYNIYIN